MSRLLGCVVGVALCASPAFADRPKTIYIPTTDRTEPVGQLGYNTIYLNSCRPNGCVVHGGSTDSRYDTSSITSGGTLGAFPYSDQAWKQVVQCVQDVFYPFNVVITDVDPGTAQHFEIMIGGNPGDLNFSNAVGGVSPFTCGVISNSLVFDFAAVWQGSVEEICATAAQEVAHSFAMDHVDDASDPMTYLQYNGRRYFKDNVPCGSDCVSGRGPFPPYPTCNAQGQHACTCTGNADQNDIQTITSLFGAGSPQPIMVKITNPMSGSAEQPGFPVDADITNNIGISKAELRVDNNLVLTLTTAPYAFNAPSDLAPGTHHIEVTGYDHYGATGMASIDIYIGAPCTKPSDCPDQSLTCVGGRCVQGPGTQGGLGSPCMHDTDCGSGQCASNGTNSFCVEPCSPGQCPPSFGCEPTMGSSSPGVCWPGFDDGTGGGCDAGSTGTDGGKISLGLMFAALLLARRKR